MIRSTRVGMAAIAGLTLSLASHDPAVVAQSERLELAGLQAPGVTVNRYCSSSLQTIRMAAHAIAAGEGDCFVAGGVETISRYGAGMADQMPNTHNPRFADAEARDRHEEGWTGCLAKLEALYAR